MGLVVVRFACLLLVALPVTSIFIMQLHQDAAQELESFASVERKLLSNNAIGGRRMGTETIAGLESSKSKSYGGSEDQKATTVSELVFSTSSSSSSSSNGSKGGKKKQISKLQRKQTSSGSAFDNADYMTYMHHPPKHN